MKRQAKLNMHVTAELNNKHKVNFNVLFAYDNNITEK